MTVTGKVILLGIAVGLALFKKKPTESAPVEGAPEPEVTPEPTITCAAPVLAKRWTLCNESGNKYTTTISEGDYDAIYDEKSKRLLAVVDNTTYDDAGDSAWVAGIYNPNGYVEVVSTREDVPFFPTEFGSDIYG